MWKVETKFSYGWDDACWTETVGMVDRPQRFATKADADAAIDEMIVEQHEAVERGNMQEKYNRADYRSVECSDELDTHLMTDQPPTCPECGARVDIIEGAETDKQVCECPICKHKFRLEAEPDDE